MRALRALTITFLLSLGLITEAGAQASPFEQANQVRAQAGLAALGTFDDPVARDISEQLLLWASGGPGERRHCGCFVDRPSLDGPVDAAELYRRSGGQGNVAFWSYESQGGPLTRRAIWAYLIDPRVEAMLYSRSGSRVAVAFRYRDEPLPDLQLSHSGVFDLHGPAPLYVLLPGWGSRSELLRGQGPAWRVEAPIYLQREIMPSSALVEGLGGAVMVNLAWVADWASSLHRLQWLTASPVVLAYDTSYRLGGREFRTLPAPSRQAGAPVRFGSGMNRRLRGHFRAHLRAAPGPVRQRFALLDGWVTIKAHRYGDASVAGESESPQRPYYVDYLASHIDGRNRESFHLAMHELGHLFDFAGLTQAGQQAFQRAFERSRRYRDCFPGSEGKHSCAGGEEIFAEQFAFYATGNRGVRTIYRVPALLSRRQFARLLDRWWKPRPYSYGFPVGSNGLHPAP